MGLGALLKFHHPYYVIKACSPVPQHCSHVKNNPDSIQNDKVIHNSGKLLKTQVCQDSIGKERVIPLTLIIGAKGVENMKINFKRSLVGES